MSDETLYVGPEVFKKITDALSQKDQEILSDMYRHIWGALASDWQDMYWEGAEPFADYPSTFKQDIYRYANSYDKTIPGCESLYGYCMSQIEKKFGRSKQENYYV